jgi:hypothetical protein
MRIGGDVVVSNGDFWISLNSGEQNIIRKLEKLQEQEYQIESFRIFNIDDVANNSRMESAIVNVFRHYRSLGHHWKQLYMKVSSQNDCFQSVLSEAMGMFEEITLRGWRL